MVVVVVVVTLMIAALVVVVGVVVLVIVVRALRELCIGVVEVVGVLWIGVVEVDCIGVVDIMVLGGVFVVEVVEGVELVVGYVVRLVLWCANGRGFFLCCFDMMSIEMNGLSVGGFLFGIVIWADFLLLGRKFLVVEVAMVEAVDVVQAGFFDLSRRGCLWDMVDVKVVIEVVVDVVVLVWWGWFVV